MNSQVVTQVVILNLYFQVGNSCYEIMRASYKPSPDGMTRRWKIDFRPVITPDLELYARMTAIRFVSELWEVPLKRIKKVSLIDTSVYLTEDCHLEGT